VHVGGGCEAPYDTRESVSEGTWALQMGSIGHVSVQQTVVAVRRHTTRERASQRGRGHATGGRAGCRAWVQPMKWYKPSSVCRFAEGPVQETIDHAAFAAYSDGSGSHPKPNVKPNATFIPSTSKATSDPVPDELTLHQLQKLFKVIQSHRGDPIPSVPSSSPSRNQRRGPPTTASREHKAYAADSSEYALGAVPLRPSARSHSSSEESEFETFR
jgi:hypothetical protein